MSFGHDHQRTPERKHPTIGHMVRLGPLNKKVVYLTDKFDTNSHSHNKVGISIINSI
jgi:hypothetical protein